MNDTATGLRSEVLEVSNTNYTDQLRQSKAQMFRENHNHEDISKEPLSVQFNTVMAFGTTKNPDKTKLMMNYQAQAVQSQSNIISSLSLFKFQMAQNNQK